MQLPDPEMLPVAYLILRQLYDGDVIDWPIGDDHPQHAVFAAIEAQGYIARWDRMWPRHDRYRLTDQGIAAIEAVYRPATAEALLAEVRGQNLAAGARRAYLAQRGFDPLLWPLLHDPTTHWDSWPGDRGRYHAWFWEDQQPYRARRAAMAAMDPRRDDDGTGVDLDDDDDDDGVVAPAVAHLVDLDREAAVDGTAPEPVSADHEVS
jgi:hypothetical protein